MINSLIKLANTFDYNGKTKQANKLNKYILKCAEEDIEPSAEDLMNEEKWLQDEGIDPYSIETDYPSEEDEMMIEEPSSIGGDHGAQDLLRRLKEMQEDDVNSEMTQQMIMDELSNLLFQGKVERKLSGESLGDLPFQSNNPLVGEASLRINDIVRLADLLDSKGRHKEADYFDRLAVKLAQGGPDDFFGDDDEDSDLYDDDDFDAPSDEDMSELSEDEDDTFYMMLEFISKVADGMFVSLQAAQEEANSILMGHDTKDGVYDAPKSFEPKALPADNVLKFPGQ